jgi:hypothetical protein
MINGRNLLGQNRASGANIRLQQAAHPVSHSPFFIYVNRQGTCLDDDIARPCNDKSQLECLWIVTRRSLHQVGTPSRKRSIGPYPNQIQTWRLLSPLMLR